MAVRASRQAGSGQLLHPSQCRFVKLLAHLLLAYQSPDRALALLAGLHVLIPDDAEVLKMLAWARFQSRDYPGALESCRAYRSKVGQKDEHAPILLLQARVLWRLGREQQARQALSDYLEARI